MNNLSVPNSEIDFCAVNVACFPVVQASVEHYQVGGFAYFNGARLLFEVAHVGRAKCVCANRGVEVDRLGRDQRLIVDHTFGNARGLGPIHRHVNASARIGTRDGPIAAEGKSSPRSQQRCERILTLNTLRP